MLYIINYLLVLKRQEKECELNLLSFINNKLRRKLK